MKILHCCLSCFYIDNYSYQENILPRLNAKHGHEVKVIASTETFIENGQLGYLTPKVYYTSEGIQIIRLPYKKWLPHCIMRKIRAYKGTYDVIEKYEPDIIMFHGMAALDMLTIVKYVKKHPKTRLYVDSHEDAHNSGTNFLSKHILHEMFYRNIIKKSLPYIEKVFYITEETKNYVQLAYKVPNELLEYYPLGGEIDSEDIRIECRKTVRERYQIKDDELVLMHSGKLDTLKKTELLLDALQEIPSDKLILFIAGSIPKECEHLKEKITMDSRVRFVGWLDSRELRKYLYASDIYVQPGTQSATMQNAICCGLPVMLYPYSSHKKLCLENVFWVEETEDIKEAILQLLNNPDILSKMKNASWKIATEILDYDMLAKRIEK